MTPLYRTFVFFTGMLTYGLGIYNLGYLAGKKDPSQQVVKDAQKNLIYALDTKVNALTNLSDMQQKIIEEYRNRNNE